MAPPGCVAAANSAGVEDTSRACAMAEQFCAAVNCTSGPTPTPPPPPTGCVPSEPVSVSERLICDPPGAAYTSPSPLLPVLPLSAVEACAAEARTTTTTNEANVAAIAFTVCMPPAGSAVPLLDTHRRRGPSGAD